MEIFHPLPTFWAAAPKKFLLLLLNPSLMGDQVQLRAQFCTILDFWLRTRNSIRGFVRPSVRPFVRPLRGHGSKSGKTSFSDLGWGLDAPAHPSATVLWPRVTCFQTDQIENGVWFEWEYGKSSSWSNAMVKLMGKGRWKSMNSWNYKQR